MAEYLRYSRRSRTPVGGRWRLGPVGVREVCTDVYRAELIEPLSISFRCWEGRGHYTFFLLLTENVLTFERVFNKNSTIVNSFCVHVFHFSLFQHIVKKCSLYYILRILAKYEHQHNHKTTSRRIPFEFRENPLQERSRQLP